MPEIGIFIVCEKIWYIKYILIQLLLTKKNEFYLLTLSSPLNAWIRIARAVWDGGVVLLHTGTWGWIPGSHIKVSSTAPPMLVRRSRWRQVGPRASLASQSSRNGELQVYSDTVSQKLRWKSNWRHSQINPWPSHTPTQESTAVLPCLHVHHLCIECIHI